MLSGAVRPVLYIEIIAQCFMLNIWFGLKIRDTDAAVIVAQLLFLEAEETQKPIHLYINSPGGSVTAGMAIYDTVSY